MVPHTGTNDPDRELVFSMHKAVPLQSSSVKPDVTYSRIGLCNPAVAASAREGSDPASGMVAVKLASPPVWI